MIQKVILFVIVGVAVYFLFRRGQASIKTFSSSGKGGCGTGCGCKKK